MATTKITSPDLFDLGSLNTALKLPSGTTAERPTSPSTGEWRYNTTTNLVEYYDGGSWRELVSELIPPVPGENFNVKTYTGNGSTQSITGVGFQPDFTWIKKYNASGTFHMLTTTRIGTGEQFRTNSTLGRNVSSDCITSFDSDGFSLGSNANVNDNTDQFVAYSWKVNGGTSDTNNEGSSTSTVEVNQGNGISMFSYSGTGSAGATVGHGLGATPDMFFMMDRYNGGGWRVWHKGMTSAAYYLEWNSSNAETSSSGAFNSTAPTSSVITLGSDLTPNGSGRQFIAWAFTSITGFSKFDSYTGNGSTNGPVINTGFEPAFVIIKRTDAADAWYIYDNARTPNNPRNGILLANTDNEQLTNTQYYSVDFLSNGFQPRSDVSTATNDNGGNYIYMAFAKTASSTPPTLADSFANKLYTGTGVDPLNITGLGFQPSLVWIKSRDVAREHIWSDSNRGVSREISSSDSSAEELRGVTAFDSDGFTLDNSSLNYNGAAENYVSWNWKANSIPTINTDGSVQSLVSANQAAGFSIVRFKTPSTDNFSVGHGLGAAPDLVFYKCRSQTSNWTVYDSISGATKYLLLNGAGAQQTDSLPFNDTEPTSTVLNLGSATVWWATNAEYIAYAFKSISGYSKIGTYTGNGSTQSITGVGFQPSWLMIKQINDSNSWRIFDSARGLSAPQTLFANLTSPDDSESNTVSSFDSDGWTMGSQQGVNDSGDTYLYLAVAENPSPVVPAGQMAYLVVAGGAGGGGTVYPNKGGGGGAGGLRTSFGSTSGGGASAESNITLYSGTYTITVGAGGGAAANGAASSISGGATVSTVGGGQGGAISVSGTAGGSGGGMGGNNTGGLTGGAGTAGEGFDGGTTGGNAGYDGSGGGGAAQAGGNGGFRNSTGGVGGNGLEVSITGTGTYYAGGGGGGSDSSSTGGRPGGLGGGGAGGDLNVVGGNGTANLGGGAGAGGENAQPGSGGSGVVILRLRTSDYSGTTTGSPTVTTTGDETVLTFTGSGTYVHS